jgi:hypothetical protein
MPEVFNIYCDESSHLENDRERVMVLGSIWVPTDKAGDLAESSRKLKARFGLARDFELKWGKVSAGRLDYYTAVLDWFLETADLHFRALIVPDKDKLDHARFDQSHDDWYYRMYFDLLKVIIDPKQRYRIYLDIKDTRGGRKVRKLHEALSNAHYDFSRSIIERIQLVRSHEVELLQLADFLTGMIAYVNRGLCENPAKTSLIRRLQATSGYGLRQTTLLRESKINLFRWHAREDA